ncbi:MAG TPA: helix-turn-helix domain-containing protein [Mesorhizobium sp.]|nr:helix-turn-helix domain-containing protein [Mesorhizobium sp.]
MEESVAREWITSNGHRDAVEQLAHLFCELFIRLKGVGLAKEDSIDWPLIQTQMGEATGMSTVHVNRTLQELRDRGLVVLKGKTLTIPDLEALKAVAMFNPNYLHLDRNGQSLDANEQ